MKKIAYLLGSLNRGGTETLMLDVFRNAKANQLEAIGIYRKTGAFENEFISSGMTLFFLPVTNLVSYIIRLRGILNYHKIDIAHAQQPIDALFALFACLFTKTKVILTLHGYDFSESSISVLLLKGILKCTFLNIYVSNSLKSYYTEKYKLQNDKQKTIYNGIGFEKFKSKNSSTSKDDLKIAADCFLLGTVGNFVTGRNQMSICKFLVELQHQNIPFHFLFVGKRNELSPERYDDCVRYISLHGLSDRVHFLGSRNDVPDLLKLLDAFIYATDHDTFGIAVVEAMACGIPVFVNDWEVMCEITENGDLATLYKTNDEKDLFRQFSLFLHNKEAYIAKAQKAANVVNSKYSIEKHIHALKKLYRQVLLS